MAFGLFCGEELLATAASPVELAGAFQLYLRQGRKPVIRVIVGNQQPTLLMWTDGACSGNPGPGGWAVVWDSPEGTQNLSGGIAHTTNNRMELVAILHALETAVRCGARRVVIHTDSQNAIGWLALGWKRKNVGLRELLYMIDKRMERLEVSFVKVAAHSGDLNNEIADKLAKAALQRYR